MANDLKTTPFDPILQLTLFMDNKVGRLRDIIKLLRDVNVHVMAVCSFDATESSITRLILDDNERAMRIFDETGIHYSKTQVVGVELKSESDLSKILSVLVQAEINIQYVYPFLIRPLDASAIAIHLEEPEMAAHTLNQHGLRILGQRDISR